MTDQLTRILATLKDGKATCDLPKADKRTLNEWLAVVHARPLREWRAERRRARLHRLRLHLS